MKFISNVAAIAAIAGAINLEAETETQTRTSSETTLAAETNSQSEQSMSPPGGYAGPIVPEDYYSAVQNFDLSKATTDQEGYKKQLDIYSDQIIAIEALRVEVMKLDYAITEAQNDQESNRAKIRRNADRIVSNHQMALDNKASIEKLSVDMKDVDYCLNRQYSEEGELRRVLELYCHQFTYVARLPYQCEQVLGSGPTLHQAYKWPSSKGSH